MDRLLCRPIKFVSANGQQVHPINATVDEVGVMAARSPQLIFFIASDSTSELMDNFV